MIRLRDRVLAVLVLVAAATAAVAETAEDTRFPMRWRVFCDAKTGTAFSYPYDLFPVDQYKGDLGKERAYEMEGTVTLTDENGKTRTVQMVKEKKDEGPEIHHFS